MACVYLQPFGAGVNPDGQIAVCIQGEFTLGEFTRFALRATRIHAMGVSMARKSQDLKRIEAREHELAARIGQLERELETLRDERRKVQTAREVLEELSGMPGAPMEQSNDVDVPPAAADEIAADAQAFADMTIGEMAVKVLQSGPTEGMTSLQILEAINHIWTTNVQRSSLSPPLSRLKKRGIIDLVGEHWKLAAGNEAKSVE